MRKLYLDNTRWITVAIVVIYHVIYMYNGVETFGVIGAFNEVQYQDVLLYLVYPWFMLLLFVISGVSARFYLEKHTEKEFFKSRTQKLLVPSTLGLFVFQWILGCFNMMIGGAEEIISGQIPAPIKYLIMAVSGIGPLWYIQLLWVFSVLLLLFRKIERGKLYQLCEKVNVPLLLAFTVPIFLAAQVLNTPIVTVYRFGIYGLGFLIGYFCLSHDAVMEKLGRAWIPLAIAAVVLGIAFVCVFWGKPYAEGTVLETLLCNVYAWISVLAILSFMHEKGNFENRFSIFMKKQAWGLYIFHYLPLSVCAYYLAQYEPEIPVVMYYLLTGAAAFGIAYLLNGIVSHIPVVRWCVLGIQTKNK